MLRNLYSIRVPSLLPVKVGSAFDIDDLPPCEWFSLSVNMWTGCKGTHTLPFC